jgi:signal transduction histidine kinase/ligand-binding sensor domain-containing protein
MAKKNFLLLFPTFILNLFIVTGQPVDQKFYHLSRDNGLSQSTINCIIKDSAGYMWFGTNDGLNRYDGYNFTHYKYDPANQSSIGLGRVRTLFIDLKGQLWVGTDQGGLYQYQLKYDNFRRYPRNLNHDSKGSYIDIRDILETDDGRLWIATLGDGLLLYNPSNDSVFKIKNDNFLNIECLEYFHDDLLIGTESGVFTLKGAKNGISTFNFPEPLPKLAGFQVFRIHSGNDSLVWIGTYGNGAFAYNFTTGDLKEYSTKQNTRYKLSHDIVRDFIEGEDNTLIIATGGGGLNILNRNTHEIIYVKSKLNDQFSLNSDIIYKLYRDDTENLWIGTYNGGANVLFKAKDKFGHIKSFGGKNDLSNNSVLSLLETNDGKIWVGTDGGGLDLFNPLTGMFQNFKHNPYNSNSLSGDVVKTLHYDKKGQLWIGTFNEGLTVYDIKNNKFTRYYNKPSDSSGLSQNHIWDIAEDRKGHIWIATLGGGLDKFNPVTGKFTHYRNNPELPNSLSDNVLSCLLYDSKGTLWVGTEFGGVNKLIDEEKGIFKVYNRGVSEGLINSNQISSIFEDSRHNIWIGTIGGGLNLFNEDEDRFISYTEADGLANNLIYGILEDNKGNLWISTNNGISEFVKAVERPVTAIFKNYTVGDGLQSNEFCPQSVCKTAEGVLYFGGINGINFFNPEHIIFNEHIPPIVLTDFRIFNQPVKVGKPGSPLRLPISQVSEIRLNHKQTVITFEFAALDFTMPSKNRYKYKLEGFETEWNDVGNNRTATYTNLNNGKYIFRVIGSNNDERWNLEGASINLIIKPPFWKTWLFRVAMIVIGIFLIIVVYRLKLQSLEKNKRTLKNLIDERTRSLLDLNHLLEKQNREIQFHRGELLLQKENLIKINKELARKQDQIQEQNDELENHRHNLEVLVNQRTSELEKSKLKAEESDRLKSSFLSNMSHEIRTPLNAIVGFSALLGEGDVTQEERLDFIKQINANSDTLLVLIDDILDLSKIESNQLKIVCSEVKVNDFLNELYNNFIFRIKPDIKLILTNPIQDQNISIYSDRTRLRQILTNLLDNAFKFTEHGVIELGVSRIENSIIFHVKDTGIGMSEVVRNKIFERFYKSDENGERVYRGTGLGLTITKKLVKILGGSITVISHEGEGSHFEITFPI